MVQKETGNSITTAIITRRNDNGSYLFQVIRIMPNKPAEKQKPQSSVFQTDHKDLIRKTLIVAR